MQYNAKVKALEEEVERLRLRADDAERKLEDCPSKNEEVVGAPTPPPPPPPPPMAGLGPAPPPPPPPPPMNLMNGGGGGLGSSLQNGLSALKKSPRIENGTPNGSCDGQTKPMVSASPQIDDIVSQLKQGIKLRHIDRTIPRRVSLWLAWMRHPL